VRRLSIPLAAVVAALMIAALAGAGSASATVLCKENTTTCAAESIYPSGTTVSATLESGKYVELATEFGTVKCSSSTMSGKTTAEKGAPLPIEISSLSVSGCGSVGPCAEAGEARNLPYAAGVERTEAGNGTFTVSSGGKGNPSLKFFNCGPFKNLTCVWGASQIAFSLAGGNPAHLEVSKKTLSRETEGGGSNLCPLTASLTASYEVTSPKPVYARAAAGVGNTAICKENVLVCPSKSATYPGGTSIEAKAAPVALKNAWGTLECGSSSMSFESSAESGKPLGLKPLGFTFSSCVGMCETAAGEIESPSLEATTGGNGTLEFNSYIWMTGCGSFHNIICAYRAWAIPVAVTGGAEKANVNIAKVLLNRVNTHGGNPTCPVTMEVVLGTYYINTPIPFWLTKAEL
jgi:hypothetical protein